MSDVRSKIKKRRCYPVDLGGGDIVHCRALTIGELKAVETLPKDDKTPFFMGCAITDDKGAQEFPRQADETLESYCVRLHAELEDMPTENIAAISAAIGRIGKVPEPDVLKN